MARKYDREFKLDAIRMASEEGQSAAEVERRLGLSVGIISRWKKQLKDKGDEVFPGIGHLSDRDEENRRLRRELERVSQERDILKNIVGTLATTCGRRNSERWVSFSIYGRRDRLLTGDTIPVKKRGPGILADLRLATPSGDPV